MTEMKLPRIAPHLNLDSDGVLMDFDKLAREILGMDPQEFEDEYGSKRFWQELEDYRDEHDRGFFEALPLMPDAMELFNGVKHLKPTILTGAPHGRWAREQKIRAAARNFPGTKIIVCPSVDKIKHMEERGDVLVDDMLKHRHHWINGGGVFVHHTSAKKSLAELRELCPIWFQHTDRWTPPKAA